MSASFFLVSSDPGFSEVRARSFAFPAPVSATAVGQDCTVTPNLTALSREVRVDMSVEKNGSWTGSTA
jgi:hypothetical protein